MSSGKARLAKRTGVESFSVGREGEPDGFVPFKLPTPEEQAEFDRLADRFEACLTKETRIERAIVPIMAMVEMGPVAIQPILSRLAVGSPLWHMPLQMLVTAYTGNPTRRYVEKRPYDPNIPFSFFEGDKQAWLRWGRKKGYSVKLADIGDTAE